jgi:hypothetical protein
MACKSPTTAHTKEPVTEAAEERIEQTVAHRDIDVELPCIDGMLMGTLALMTGYAEHQCEQGNPRSRDLMAKKIVSNLFFLAAHPSLSVPMAAVMRNLQKHWHTLSALASLEAPAVPSEAAANRPSRAQASQASALSQLQAHWLPEHASVQ